MLEARDIAGVYHGVAALRDVSFEIAGRDSPRRSSTLRRRCRSPPPVPGRLLPAQDALVALLGLAGVLIRVRERREPGQAGLVFEEPPLDAIQTLSLSEY